MLNFVTLAMALATTLTPANTTDTISTQRVERSTVAQVAQVAEATETNVKASEETETETETDTTVEYLRPNLYYFTDTDDVLWEFQMKYELPVGIEPESDAFFEYMAETRWNVKSLVFRKHVGEAPKNVYIGTAAEMLNVPDGGMTATDYKGGEMPYELYPNSTLIYIDVIELRDALAHTPGVNVTPTMLTLYDYNLDGEIGIEDLVEVSKRLFSSPCSWLYHQDGVWFSWEDDFLPLLEENSSKEEFEITNPEVILEE